VKGGEVRTALGERRHARLSAAAAALEISEQELVRRAIDAYVPPDLHQVAAETPPVRLQIAAGGTFKEGVVSPGSPLSISSLPAETEQVGGEGGEERGTVAVLSAPGPQGSPSTPAPSLFPGHDKTPSKRRRRVEIAAVEVPTELREAVDQWLDYKRERGESYKPSGFRALLEQMLEWGPARTLAAVANSRRNNWAGLFEPKPNGTQVRAPTRAMGGDPEHMAEISRVGSEAWEPPDFFMEGGS
jgi:hypothetical protein